MYVLEPPTAGRRTKLWGDWEQAPLGVSHVLLRAALAAHYLAHLFGLSIAELRSTAELDSLGVLLRGQSGGNSDLQDPPVSGAAERVSGVAE
jgi:hypothetical protein